MGRGHHIHTAIFYYIKYIIIADLHSSGSEGSFSLQSGQKKPNAKDGGGGGNGRSFV